MSDRMYPFESIPKEEKQFRGIALLFIVYFKSSRIDFVNWIFHKI